jgi:hypothetical protein
VRAVTRPLGCRGQLPDTPGSLIAQAGPSDGTFAYSEAVVRLGLLDVILTADRPGIVTDFVRAHRSCPGLRPSLPSVKSAQRRTTRAVTRRKASMGLTSSGVGGRGAVALQHRAGLPAGQARWWRRYQLPRCRGAADRTKAPPTVISRWVGGPVGAWPGWRTTTWPIMPSSSCWSQVAVEHVGQGRVGVVGEADQQPRGAVWWGEHAVLPAGQGRRRRGPAAGRR